MRSTLEQWFAYLAWLAKQPVAQPAMLRPGQVRGAGGRPVMVAS